MRWPTPPASVLRRCRSSRTGCGRCCRKSSAERLAGLVMFRMVAATGARILTAVDFKHNRYNLFVVAISVGFGMIPLAAPGFFRKLPHDLQPLLESGILVCAIVDVMLNAL